MATRAAGRDLIVGTKLGHYRILEKIGAGGMGAIYRARDEHLDRTVAVKILPVGLLAHEESRKRFRKEALALSRLNHPNIATIHDFDTQGGMDFLVMEYIPGGTLAEKLAKGALPEKEAIALGIQLADGLSAAHEHGVIHRDLKPANLQITGDRRLKILDFGVAKLRVPVTPTAATATGDLTQSHGIVGTLPYMAPEQLLGKETDARTDIHAAGCVLYEMATGAHPFADMPAGDLVSAILSRPPSPPATVNPSISAELARITSKCLEKDPEARYQSAREIAIDLRRMGSATAPVPPLPVPHRWSKTTGVAALVVLALLLALSLIWRTGMLRTRPTPSIQSLAVLPLANVSGDPAQEYLSDGMTDELITTLGKLPSIRVISRTSIMRYKKTDKSLPEIAKELNVDAVVEGSVRRAGDRVRITAQLVQASDRRLWGETYDRDLRDVLSLQSDVAGAIVSQVRAELAPQEQKPLVRERPVNPEAYALYLQGRALWGRDTPTDNHAATDALEHSIAIDSQFAPAYAALARAYSDRLFLFEPKDEWKNRAEAAIDKALALDPDSAEAHLSRAVLLFTPAHGWQYEKATQECRQALALNPNLAEAHLTLGMIFVHIGLFEGAIHEFRQAATLNPNISEASLYTAFALTWAGKFDEASVFLRSTEPSLLAKIMTANNLLNRGRGDEAWGIMRQLLKVDPQEKLVYVSCLHAGLLAYSGKGPEAERMIREKILPEAEAMKAYGHFHHVANCVADIYAQLNKSEEAVKWLEETAATGFPCYSHFESDPALDPIRQDPRFIAFMQKLKPQWEHYKLTYGSKPTT